MLWDSGANVYLTNDDRDFRKTKDETTKKLMGFIGNVQAELLDQGPSTKENKRDTNDQIKRSMPELYSI